jgi:transcription elongation factor Elf1
MIDIITINRAMLGDIEAADRCTAAGVVIPCPDCKADNISNAVVDGCQTWVIDCPQCGRFHSEGVTAYDAIRVWNTRDDMMDIARQLTATQS